MTEDLAAARESGGFVRHPWRLWAVLDVVKGNGPDPRLTDSREGCPRWPEGRFLVSRFTGEAVLGRCGCTNKCSYCRDIFLRETAAVVALGAQRHPPTVYMVLTARAHLARADCKHPLEMIRRWALREWPDCQWFMTVEMQKRYALHLNLLIRGVPAADAGRFERLAAREWCKRVDALPVGQHAEAIWDADGVQRYVAKFSEYVTKVDQQPRVGWTGHRTSQTRCYFPEGMARMRAQARAHLAHRVLYAQALDRGLRGLAAVSWATNQRALIALAGWQLVDVSRAHSARPTQRGARDPVCAGAQCRASQRPSATVQRDVDDHGSQLALLIEGDRPRKNRGPQRDRS